MTLLALLSLSVLNKYWMCGSLSFFAGDNSTFNDGSIDDLVGRDGHAMEARVYWHDTSYVRMDKLVIHDR